MQNNKPDVKINISNSGSNNVESSIKQKLMDGLNNVSDKTVSYLKKCPGVSYAIKGAEYYNLVQGIFYSTGFLSIAATAAYTAPVVCLPYGALITATALADKYYFKDEDFSKLKIALSAAPIILQATAHNVPNEFINAIIVKDTLLCPNFGQDLNRLFSILKIGSNGLEHLTDVTSLTTDQMLDIYNAITGTATNISKEQLGALLFVSGAAIILEIPVVADKSKELFRHYTIGIGENVVNTTLYTIGTVKDVCSTLKNKCTGTSIGII